MTPEPTLFSPAPPERLQAAERAAERDVAWKAEALVFLEGWCRRHSQPFLMEEVAGLFRSAPDKRAWGGICQSALRCGLIEGVGFAKDAYGSPKTLWQSKVYRA